MAKGNGVLTTGDIAKICKVSPKTVAKWFDSGILCGYRLPSSKDRRVPIDELLCFMKKVQMPLHFLKDYERSK